MVFDPGQILFTGNFFDDDPDTIGVADADLSFASFFEDTVGEPKSVFIIPTEGPDPIPPPPCPDLTLYDLLPEIVRLNDPDEALKAVIDAADAEYCKDRDDIFKLTQLIDPRQAPTEVLPHLAATFDIKDFNVEDNEMLLREQIATAAASYKLKGSIDGIQLALLFLGWQTEVIELYEQFDDTAPNYVGLGGGHQRQPGPGRRPDSDIIILVKPLVKGKAFDAAARARIRERLSCIIPIHVEIIEIGRFTCPIDKLSVTDLLALVMVGAIVEGLVIDDPLDIIIILFGALPDGISVSDALIVNQTGIGTELYDDPPQLVWDSGNWDGGSSLLRSV